MASAARAMPADVNCRTPTLAEWPYLMVRLACDLCPRRKQQRKVPLIARLGGDVSTPDVQCPRKDAAGEACGVYYADAWERSRPVKSTTLGTPSRPHLLPFSLA
jgi:hypothetical protein